MRRSTSGFTLIELLVVVAIIGILAGILFPVFSSVREKAHQTSCLSNQRQIAQAIIIYAHDHEKFPGMEWAGEIDIPGGKNILKCPNVDEGLHITGYGMNTYLHGLKQDVVQRPHQVVLTCDSITSSTISADHLRHRGFAIYSRCDSSAVCVKNPEKGGRFAAGKFPLTPFILVGTTQVDMSPDNFKDYPANTPIADKFLIAGPYGSDDQTMAVTIASDLLEHDYLMTEDEFAKTLADEIPMPGEAAPYAADIKTYVGDPGGAKLLKNWQYGAVGTWTPSSGPVQNCVQLELPQNYATQYPKRTTYAMLFVYSDQPRSTTIKFLIDDVGAVWLNGGRIFTDPNDGDLNTEAVVNQVTRVLPKGISFILFRCTNFELGGAKFNIIFDQPVKAGGAI